MLSGFLVKYSKSFAQDANEHAKPKPYPLFYKLICFSLFMFKNVFKTSYYITSLFLFYSLKETLHIRS